jgi:hypothetical protein
VSCSLPTDQQLHDFLRWTGYLTHGQCADVAELLLLVLKDDNAAELERLRAEVEALRPNDRRYRWLLEALCAHGPLPGVIAQAIQQSDPDSVSALIDAAIAKAEAGNG